MIQILTLLSLIASGVATYPTHRVVVTFYNAEQARQTYYIPNTTVVKQYGRRLILSFGRDIVLSRDSETIRDAVGPDKIDNVELDLTVSLNQDYTYSQITPTLQWNLKDSEPYSIKAEQVWRISNSSQDIVVAVIDTGLAGIANTILLHPKPGYDFISDVDISLDGDGRDDDSTDPGTAASECPVSSWHGTKVTSILAARHDSGLMKGVAQNCSLMNIRALGRCSTGYANDVADAIVYAAGGIITGVQTNRFPAKIIGMSFSGAAACPGYLQSAINQAISLGSIIVVSAGNSADDAADYFPANCKNVIAVAASTRSGTLAPYSNFGDFVIAAPGGDNQNPIAVVDIAATNPPKLTLSYGLGTSMAVPHITGFLAIRSEVFKSTRFETNLNPTVTNLFLNKIPFAHNCQQNTCGHGIFVGLMPPDQVNLLLRNVTQSESTIIANAVLQSQCCKNCLTNCVSFYGSNCYQSTMCGSICPAVMCGAGYYYYLGCSTMSEFARLCFNCETCKSGFYISSGCMDTTDSVCTSCLTCAAGTYRSSGCSGSSDSICTLCTCPANTYMNSGCSGATPPICLTCPANTKSPGGPSPAITTCTANAGYYGPAGSPASPCPSGNYCLGSTQYSPCTSCVAGTNYETRACTATQDRLCSACTTPYNCSSGTYPVACTTTTNFRCAACAAIPANSVFITPTTLACTWACNAGYYKVGSACVGCPTISCVVGEYPSNCHSVSGVTCVPCTNKPASGSVFTSNSSQGNDNCQWTCSAGFSGSMALGSCNRCVAGFFTNTTGSSSCYPCPVNTFANLTGATQCTVCAVSSETGKFRYGCGGAYEGFLQQCTNT